MSRMVFFTKTRSLTSPRMRISGAAVVLDGVLLEPVAVGGHAERFVAEEHAVLLVLPDGVVAEEVVGVLVADGDAELAVLLQEVLLEQAVTDPPAEEQAIRPVAAGHAVADRRPLRAAARMKPEDGVVLRDAVCDGDVVGLLEADAVAVVVPHDAAADDGAEPPVQEDAAAPAAVQRDIRLLVALDDQILDPHAFGVVAR